MTKGDRDDIAKKRDNTVLDINLWWCIQLRSYIMMYCNTTFVRNFLNTFLQLSFKASTEFAVFNQEQANIHTRCDNASVGYTGQINEHCTRLQ